MILSASRVHIFGYSEFGLNFTIMFVPEAIRLVPDCRATDAVTIHLPPFAPSMTKWAKV